MRHKGVIFLITMIFLVSVISYADEIFLKYGVRPWLNESGEYISLNETHFEKRVIEIIAPLNATWNYSKYFNQTLNTTSKVNFSELDVGKALIRNNGTMTFFIVDEGIGLCIGTNMSLC